MDSYMAEEVTEIPGDIAEMSFDTAMAALEEIVQKLENGAVGLEDSIDLYARGAQLKAHCEAKLKSASEKVEKIVLGSGGEASGREALDVE
jgi:exodeoxyribonuclease VII small subunit